MSSESCRAARWLARALALCLVTAPALATSRSVKELLSARRDLIDCPSSLVL